MSCHICPEFSVELWVGILRLLPLPNYVTVRLYGFDHLEALTAAKQQVGDDVTFKSLGSLDCRLKNFTTDTLIKIYQDQERWNTEMKEGKVILPNICINEVSWNSVILTRTRMEINLSVGKEPAFLKLLERLFKDSGGVPLILTYV